MVNIKVAVRIRPFSPREIIVRDDAVVEKENNSILVTNPKIPEKQDGDSRLRTRRFTVDFCYDPKDPESCSQEAVYREIGSEVLDSMFDGYNACVLAYGHSASGKTYTMMGLQDDPGLTPRICQGLFDRIERKTSKDRIRFQIIISFLEIYNEKVRDLLANDETAGATAANFSLRVREHPKLGPYVQDLSHHVVSEKRKLLEFLAAGNRRRSTAATENNVHSSRSHAVFTIRFKQTDEEIYETDKSSKVHLVDLAGSLQEVPQRQPKTAERASAIQSKTRLKEGANINKSLVTLGNVISALAESFDATPANKEHSNGKTWQPFVPYRDSVLTWLLKDTLGGNSNTIMIATISPARSCLNETINTLRYAKRTKRIINQPIINEDPKIRTIRKLREEISKLRTMLISYQSCDKEVASSEDLSASNLEASTNSGSATSKCQDPGGTKFTSNEAENSEKEILKKLGVKKEPSDVEEERANNNYEEENLIWEDLGKRNGSGQKSSSSRAFPEAPKPPSLAGRGVERGGGGGGGGGGGEGDACKINAEKKSDVNGSVIDNLPHDSQIFSDSLESFASLPLKTNNPSEVEDSELDGNVADSGGLDRRKKRGCPPVGGSFSPKRKFKLCLKREFNSCENLTEKDLSAMLHRSRPDLIRGISTRSKEGLPSTSSQSCTDISNLSQSTSENSLNSSGSVDAQPSESKSRRGSSTFENRGRTSREQTQRKTARSDTFQGLRKQDKRSEIVEAVTTRLYATKKKPDPRMEALQAPDKEEDDDDGELEELKLCKRARMKLFDLSRKLAMTRRLKKTMDNDTQTDFHHETVRLKEKCVVTDQSGILQVENCGTNTSSDENLIEKGETCVIMNQVFIPTSSKYVVECGKGVRIEVPGVPTKQDLGTQTNVANKSHKSASTSPVKFAHVKEECFSDDSLDLEENSKSCRDIASLVAKDPHEERPNSCGMPLNRPLCQRSHESLTDLESARSSSRNQNPLAKVQASSSAKKASSEPKKPSESCGQTDECSKNSEEIRATLFNGLPLAIYTENISGGEVNGGDFRLSAPTPNLNLSPGSRKEENLSSENSFTSLESTDVVSSSETSSEDFVFYENPKEKEQVFRTKALSDRELYTITENSEQSDLSDALSPLQSQKSSLEACGGKVPSPKPRDENSRFQESGNSEKGEKVEREREPEGVLFFRDPCWSNQTKKQGNPEFQEGAQCSEVPNPGFWPAYSTAKCEKVPNPTFSKTTVFADAGSKDVKQKKSGSFSDWNPTEPKAGAGSQSKPKKINWGDLKSNSQKQFLNFNIQNSSKQLPFSIDTNFFGEASKRDQSTEAMFASEDSITFVFMGPAKPKTSVLMEIIRRSLDSGSSSADSPTRQKSRSRGVQCDSKLMRSVSVDTALIALSRIAKNQRPPSDVSRTTSLDTLIPDEMHAILEQGRVHVDRENKWRCDHLEPDRGKSQKKNVLKYSVCTGTTRDQQTETEESNTQEESNKPKKSVSWSGETIPENLNETPDITLLRQQNEDLKSICENEPAASSFDLNYCDSSEVEVEESNVEEEDDRRKFLSPSEQSVSHARRVRFSKPDKWTLSDIYHIINEKKEAVQSAENMSSLLKEATQLLKNLNYFSTTYEMTADEIIKQFEEVQNEFDKRRQKESKGPSKMGAEGGNQVEGRTSWEPAVASPPKSSVLGSEGGGGGGGGGGRLRERELAVNLTWPRRRSAYGKPPTGMRCSASLKCPRFPLPPRSDSFCFNGIFDVTKNCSPSSRAGSCSTNWNASSLSTTFSNSYAGEPPSRPSSSRSIYSNSSKFTKEYPSSPSRSSSRMLSPRPKINFDAILDLESDLEESCRRLEVAVEQERKRQEDSERNRGKVDGENRVSFEGNETYDTHFSEEESQVDVGKITEVAKRRKTCQCLDGCVCRNRGKARDFCGGRRSTTYRSTFELDTFGPGSKHCHQLCLFCRRKDMEMYCSAPSLNSECCFGRCRLDYYGYCPCSPVRLPYVASSPRAYMQHLLTLRRQIVRSSKSKDT